MPFEAQDHREIAAALIEELSRRGHGQILEEMIGGIRRDAPVEQPREYVLALFDQLIEALSRRSRGTYERAVDLLNEYVESPTGIADIRVSVTQDEADVFGEEDYSLSDVQQFDTLIADLRRIRESVAEE